MAGLHHRLNGHEFEWSPGVCDGQGGLACCNSWGCTESDTTERLNWTEALWGGGIHVLIGEPPTPSLTVPWSCSATSGCVCWLIDWGLTFTWIWLVILDPTDFNWFTLYLCAMSFFHRLCSAPFPPVSCSFPEPHPDPQGCLYNLLERQPENSWPWEGNTL